MSRHQQIAIVHAAGAGIFSQAQSFGCALLTKAHDAP
jgi:hypothetical protein